MENYKKALLSNKDDTSSIIALFADAQQSLDSYQKDIENYKKQIKNSGMIAPVGIGLSAIGGAFLSYGIINNNKISAATGASFIGGFCVVYCGGHWIFKIW